MKKRVPIVAGNWKMHTTRKEALDLTRGILKEVGRPASVEVVLCPPFTVLTTVGSLLTGSQVKLGAQDCFWEPQGAFTGEISPSMLAECGATYCIVGHSERRMHFGETNETVARKVQAVLTQGMTPIVCVGETLDQRKAGQTTAIVQEQLKVGLAGVSLTQTSQLAIAYEPVWAIGTGQNATPTQAQEVHAFIRQWLATRFSPAAAEDIRIQYGGSVKPENGAELSAQPDVDGFLVGGASLKVQSFVAIVHAKEANPSCTPSS